MLISVVAFTRGKNWIRIRLLQYMKRCEQLNEV